MTRAEAWQKAREHLNKADNELAEAVRLMCNNRQVQVVRTPIPHGFQLVAVVRKDAQGNKEFEKYVEEKS